MTGETPQSEISVAILAAKPRIATPHLVAFAPDIPAEPLARAIEVFAKQAKDEQALALIVSEGSGKSGFLFTDRALYFRRVLAHFWEIYRIPYEEVTAVGQKDKTLTISAGKINIAWRFPAQLLWERSRTKIAAIVITLLQAVLEKDAKPGQPSAVTIVPPPPPIDWINVFAFHAPVILFGTPLMLAAHWFIGGHQMQRVIEHIGPDRAILLGLFTLAPSIYAFGTNLTFSFGRYFGSLIFLVIISLRISVSASASGQDTIFFIPGGGVLGILVTFAFGNAGRWVVSLFRKSPKLA